MGTPFLERIRQKAEEYEKQRDEKSQFQEQVEEAYLERIRKKAEEHENMRTRNLEWQDKIEAIRETYNLSKAEIQSIILEVEQEESDPPAGQQSKNVETSLYDRLATLFFSPRGRIGRSVFALSLLGTTFVQGILASLSSLGFRPLGILGLVVFYALIVLSIKRFHDMGKSGWLTLLYLVPIVNIFIFFLQLLFEGTEGPNRFDEEEN